MTCAHYVGFTDHGFKDTHTTDDSEDLFSRDFQTSSLGSHQNLLDVFMGRKTCLSVLVGVFSHLRFPMICFHKYEGYFNFRSLKLWTWFPSFPCNYITEWVFYRLLKLRLVKFQNVHSSLINHQKPCLFSSSPAKVLCMGQA